MNPFRNFKGNRESYDWKKFERRGRRKIGAEELRLKKFQEERKRG